MCERVGVSGPISPGGTTRTTRTTTYSVKTIPGSCIVAGEVSLPLQEEPERSSATNTFEDLKNYVEETRTRVLEDPRTKQMIEKGEATLEEVKQYIKEHGPQIHQGSTGPTANTTAYSYTTGCWYPLTVGGTYTAAPNTIFEVACGDPEITKKISLRPQVDVVFDDKAKQLVLAFDLPGFENKDVSVEIDKRCLVVYGERPKEDLKTKYGESMKRIIAERTFGFFFRKFQLPPNAIEDTVSANMEKGVLTVRISTSEPKTSDKKRININ